MNKRYEEGRKPFFSESGEKFQKQYVWTKDEKGNEVLKETEPIDIQQEIESYADECDIKNIVRRASFDPQFLQGLQAGAMDGTEIDTTNWPTNIHEYHQMMATARAYAAQLKQMEEMEAEENKKGETVNNEPKQ